VIEPFSSHLPVRIRFGEGVLAELPGILSEHGAARVFVVLDERMEALLAPVGAVLSALEAAGTAVVRFERRPGEPEIPGVQEAATALAEARADVVVAIGGGSVIDTAKVARACVQLGLAAADLLRDAPPVPPADVPLVAVPTTAGTGSEASGGAVVTDPATDRKAGVASPNLRATHALVDPELTWSLPPAVTAHSGVDALAQLVAALVVRVRTPIGDAVGLEGTRLAARSLVRAVRDGSDREARADMACASLLGGLAMNIADCGAEHSIGQALGGDFHLPHGLTIGLVLAEVLDRERLHVPEQLERVGDALGVPDDGSGDGSRAVRGVRDLLAELDFPLLRDVGVTEEHVAGLARLSLDDFFITQSPVPWTADEVETVLRSALAIERRTHGG
jgi:alcohol dehydrogenase